MPRYPPRQRGEMKKIAVVYSSKSGHTKQYVDWLKEEVGDIDVIPAATFSPSQTMAYKLIIFACGVYGDKLSIMDFVKKNITAMAPQKTMIMAVSWYTNDSEDAKKKLIEENYPEQFKNIVPIFVLNSGINRKSLSAMDKMKLTAAQVMIDKKDGRSSDDINALAIIKGYSDQTSKDNLSSIKQAIDVFLNPTKEAGSAVSAAQSAKTEISPAPAAKPASETVPKPAPAPRPMDVSEMKSDADALSSLENAFKALKAPKAPESKPFGTASESQPKTEPKSAPVSSTLSKPDPKPAPAPIPQPKPEPKPAPAPQSKPNPKVDPVKASVASSVKDAIAALSSGEMITNYAPAPTFEIDDADFDTYSEAVADSIMLINQTVAASKPAGHTVQKPVQQDVKPIKPTAPKPVQQDVKPIEPTAPKPVQQDVKSIEPTAPKPVQQDVKPIEPTAPKPVQQDVRPVEPTVPKSVQQDIKPAERSVEPPQQPAQRKNSYMELFAKRRRHTEEISESAGAVSPVAPAETKPAYATLSAQAVSKIPTNQTVTVSQTSASKSEESVSQSASIAAAKPAALPNPIVQTAPKPVTQSPVKPAAKPAAPSVRGKSNDAVIDFDFIMDDGPVPTVEIPKPKPTSAASAPSIDMDVYDFISGDDSKPAVSSRAMNAVQALAKSKAEAEKEQLKSVAKTEVNDDILEKMKRDIEALAEESEHEIEVVSPTSSGAILDNDEGLEGFTFSNDIDYDLEAEFAEPADMTHRKKIREKESKTNLDIRKLQEEINASIEQNKATKEKMEQRYGKREKEEYHNPFAVQFEEDESKNKKKKKTVEVKRLADPIDPDIFFSKAGKDYDSTPGAMPEIKFKNNR